MTDKLDAPGSIWDGAEIISTYTRAEALADGNLIDVSATAREAGFRWPVALTAAAWAECVAWTEEDTARQTYQDQPGRLWDVVWMAMHAIRESRSNSGADLLYRFYCLPRGGTRRRTQLTTLKLNCGPGDDAEPVITIMLPTED